MAPCGENDAKYEEKRTHEGAVEGVIKEFLNGSLTDSQGMEVDSRKDALAIAESAGKKAVQEMKKTGTTFNVYARSK